MSKSNSKLIDVAKTIEITNDDLKAIERSKKKHKINFVLLIIVEAIIGLTSFLLGYSYATLTMVGYPYSQVMIASNISFLSQIRRKKLFIFLVVITLVISMIGFVRGWELGAEAVLKNNPPTTTYYGVYYNDN